MNTIVKNYRLAVKNTSFFAEVVINMEKSVNNKAFFVKKPFRTRGKLFIIIVS